MRLNDLTIHIKIQKAPVLLLILILLSSVSGAQEPEWETLRSRPYPEWFKEAKLGIFVHWGLYSVPAYGAKNSYSEWFLRGIQSGDTVRTRFMKEVYGEKFTYNDFAPLFTAELFDASQWAELFKEAGARYVVMVSKHHDGYCLWPSKYARNWNSEAIGPKRDLVGELTAAVRAENLKMGLYYSLPEWNYPLHRWYIDPHSNIAPYVEQHMIPQFKELVSTYRPSLIFADGEWFNTAEEWHSKALISWYFDLVGKDAVVNDRWGSGSDIGFLTPEYSSGLQATKRPWTEVRSLSRSFGLNRNEALEDYLSSRQLIHFFATAVANGGGLILNVGPGADGMIPLIQQERLLQLGSWLKVNGEAIYGADMHEIPSEMKAVTLQRVEPNIDFDFVRDTPGDPVKEDDFTAEWEGYIQPDVSAVYTFSAQADDALKVWIGDRLVVKVDEGNKGNEVSSEPLQENIRLKAGVRYPVKVSYVENKQNASASLYWASLNRAQEVIPAENFYLHNKGDEHGLKVTYRSMKEHILYTKNQGNLYAIVLQWPEQELALHIPSPPENAVISLVGVPGYLLWKYENGAVKVDVSGVGVNDLPGEHAWTFKIETQ